jgi:hypothetical protein
VIWEKLGLVYCADGQYDWAQSHAYIPTSIARSPDLIRVYVALLDQAHVGRIGYVDVDAKDPRRILKVSSNPVLDIGEPGAFDEHGVTPASLVQCRDKLWLYYFGWQRGAKLPYSLFTGLALSENGGESFARYSRAPVLERSEDEPFVRSAAYVLWCGKDWRMWYVSADDWFQIGDKKLPRYHIRGVESSDGKEWTKPSYLCLGTHGGDEFGLGRPFVVEESGLYRMWYSSRTVSAGYRLGYAESEDGMDWRRKDNEVGIDVSESGWDAQMICFACIQKTQYGTYMFYNGNGYGESGFGVASLRGS